MNKLKTKMTSAWTKAVAFANIGLTMLFIQHPAFAATDPFAKASSTAENLKSSIQGITVIVAAAMLAVCGLLYMLPIKSLKEAIKKHIGGIITGIGIVFGAGMIASYVVTWVQ